MTPLMPDRIPKVLVVEDDDAMREALVESLMFGGYEVESCESGEDALEAALTGRFDFILTDRRTPGVSCGDLSQCLRDAGLQVPVIGGTAYRNGSTERLEPSARVFFKPFRISDLLIFMEYLREAKKGIQS